MIIAKHISALAGKLNVAFWTFGSKERYCWTANCHASELDWLVEQSIGVALCCRRRKTRYEGARVGTSDGASPSATVLYKIFLGKPTHSFRASVLLRSGTLKYFKLR